MNLKQYRFIAYIGVFALIWIYFISIESCQMTNGKITTKISEIEVERTQNAWAQGIIGIGGAYTNNRDYKDLAQRHVDQFYGFDLGKVIYKPAQSSSQKFRTTAEGTVADLVGENANFPEDKGFALAPWKNISWKNAGIINGNGDIAIAMGSCTLTDTNGNESVMDYTFAYRKNDEGQLKIVAQKSFISE